MKKMLIAVFALAIFAFAATAQAAPKMLGTPTGHHVPGLTTFEGVKTPPPGLYYRLIFANFSADKKFDSDGKSVSLSDNEVPGMPGMPMPIKASQTGLVHRFIYAPDFQFLGGQPSIAAALTMFDKRLSIDAPGVANDYSRHTSGLGDSVIGYIHTWNFSQADLAFKFGVHMPTGDFSKDEYLNLGNGYWTYKTGLAGTFYFDEEKKWSLTAQAVYETHSKMIDNIDITPGDHLSLEGGAGYRFNDYVAVGVDYYMKEQVKKDTGSDLVGQSWAGNKDAIAAFGPHLKLGPNGFIDVAYWKEYAGKNRLASSDIFYIRATIPLMMFK